jgi:hypothetical protein
VTLKPAVVHHQDIRQDILACPFIMCMYACCTMFVYFLLQSYPVALLVGLTLFVGSFLVKCATIYSYKWYKKPSVSWILVKYYSVHLRDKYPNNHVMRRQSGLPKMPKACVYHNYIMQPLLIFLMLTRGQHKRILFANYRSLIVTIK